MVCKFFLAIFVSLILRLELIAADDVVEFRARISKPLIDAPSDRTSDGWVAATNVAIRSSYDEFKKFLNSSTYFCAHNDYKTRGASVTSVHPVIEYMAFLASLSKNHKIATILDHLVKTAGPFGFSKKVANSAERIIYHIAMNAVSRTLHGRLDTVHKAPTEDAAFAAVQAMHPSVHLVLPTSEERWNTLLDAIQGNDFFKAPSVVPAQRYFLLNDVFQFSFLLGVMPRYRDGTWLSDIWGNSNVKLEDDHSFIQWLFPIRTVGVDPLAPLLNDTIACSLARHPLLLNSIRAMVRTSFGRMANFWGQQMGAPTETLTLIKVDDIWHKNWLINTHNNLRMDRILRCLSFLKMGNEFRTLLTYLNETTDEAIRNGTYPSLSSSLENYWKKVPIPA
jgi:hypothetical protein